jgi:hypothetical protein
LRLFFGFDVAFDLCPRKNECNGKNKRKVLRPGFAVGSG